MVYVTFVGRDGEILLSDYQMPAGAFPRTGDRIDWQHQQPFIIGVVRWLKWTSTNGVTLAVSEREATPGPNIQSEEHAHA